MNCPRCQSENPTGILTCGRCGTKLTSAEDGAPSFTKTLQFSAKDLARGSIIAGRVRRRTYSLDRSNVLYWRVTKTPQKPEEP
jgi:hypothetical protein